MTRTALFACRDAHGPQWQLGPLAPETGRFTLLGWSQTEKVAHVVARALTSIARVTFLSSSVNPVTTGVWSVLDGNLVCRMTSNNRIRRVVARLKGSPPDIALLSTRQPETAKRLFDDAGFPWWLQGQVVLLSDPGAPPPGISLETLLALVGAEWIKHAAALVPMGIQGVLRPGVDGDVAGLLSCTPAFEQGVLAALENETRAAGFDWALRPESEFVSSL